MALKIELLKKILNISKGLMKDNNLGFLLHSDCIQLKVKEAKWFKDAEDAKDAVDVQYHQQHKDERNIEDLETHI